MATPDTRSLYRGILRDMSTSDRDRGLELLDEAQAVFEEQASRHPDIDPSNPTQLLEYIHRMLGTSPTPTRASLAELGRLLGRRTAHTVEVMMERETGTTFGDVELQRQVQFLFAGVSIAEAFARKQAEERGSDMDIPWLIQGALNTPYDKANETSIRDLYAIGLPQQALVAMNGSIRHNQEIE